MISSLITDYIRLKRHWRNIRDGYARFKRCKSARTDNKHPRSKWQFYKLLTFLDGVAPERTETNYVEELPQSNEGESQDMTYSVDTEFASFDSHQSNNTPPDATEKITISATTGNYVKEPQNDDRVTSETSNFENLLNYFKERDEKRNLAATSLKNNNPGCDVVSFSTHVKDVLIKLPPVLQIKAKRDIFDVLLKYELMSVPQSITHENNLANGSGNSNCKSDEYSELNYMSEAMD